MKRLLRNWIALFICAGSSCGLVYVDWELVLAIAAGISTIGVLFLEHRRANRLDELAVDHAERLATLEAAVTSGDTPLPERVAALEAHDLTVLGELRERVATLEARADHKPWTATRHKGKFAKTEGVTPPPEDKT